MSTMPTQKNYSVVPGLNMGIFEPQDFAKILEIINKYEVPATKITGAQRLALLGVDEEQMKSMKEELSPFMRETGKNTVTYVQACPGSKWCRFGKRDALEFGKKLEKISFDEPFTAKVKVGVSGCRMCCTEPYVRDVGLFASTKGWTLVFGGNGGSHPRIGDIIAKNLSDDEALDLLQKCLIIYQQESRPTQRSARFMERFGIEELKKRLFEDQE